MIKRVTFLGIFGAWTFFIVNSLLGKSYLGSQNSNYYIIFWLAIFSIAILIFIKGIIFSKKYQMQIINLVPILIILVLFGLSFSIFGFNSNGNVTYFKLFTIISVSSYLMGMHCAIQNGERNLFKSIEMIAILSIPAIITSFKMLISGASQYSVLDDMGGMGRMGIAYHMSLIFVYMFLVFNISSKRNKFTLFEGVLGNKTYNLVRLFFMGLCALTIISSGTRGALIVIIIIPLMYFLYLFKKNRMKLIRKLFLFSTLVTVAILMFNTFFNTEIIEFSLKRFALFFDRSSQSNDNWAGGSGREYLYSLAWSIFRENPILGIGPMGFLKMAGTYPHNIFLELLVDYGILGFTIGTTFIGFVILKYFRASKYNIAVSIMLMMFIAELIRNLFSGTFYSSYILWFFIGYGLAITPNYNTTNIRK
jgi:O-antigen ligase